MAQTAPGWAARPMLPATEVKVAVGANLVWRKVRHSCGGSLGSACRYGSGAPGSARRDAAGLAPAALLAACAASRRRSSGRAARRRVDRQGVALRAARPSVSEQGEAAREFAPVAEYRALKEDTLNSWGFLNDQDFAIRALGVFVAGLLPGLAFGAAVFPLQSAEGALLPRNAVAAALLGAFLGLGLLLAVIFRLAQQWDSVNKLLQRKAYYVEYDPTKKMDYGSGSGGAYAFKQAKSQKEMDRDKLLAEYETEPAVGRLRVYLVATLGATAASLAGFLSVGGEVRMAAEEEEEEEDEDGDGASFYKGKKKECKAGCLPGLD